MRVRDPEKMREMIDYVDRYYRKHHRSPSCGEIGEYMHASKSVVYGYIQAMQASGMISYDGRTITTPRMRDEDADVRRVSIVGSVSCGLPVDGGDDPDDYLYLPTRLVGRGGELYLLYASGDSMIDAGIDDGDMVLIRRQETANVGDIVVAWVEGEGNTLKRFLWDGKSIVLHPENPDFEDIRVDHVVVQGVLELIIKKPDRYNYLDRMSRRMFS